MKAFLQNTWKHRAHVLMALPAFLILFFFDYVVMGGLVLAFKDFDYKLGIWKSPWCGLDNFKFDNIQKSIDYLISGNIDYEFRTTIVDEYHEPEDFIENNNYII